LGGEQKLQVAMHVKREWGANKKSYDMMNTIMKETNTPTFFWFFKYCFPRMRKVLASAVLQEL
jgi:hypothetical protein